MPSLASLSWSPIARSAVAGGLVAAAIFDSEGNPLAVAGALDADQTRALASMMTRRMRGHELLARMLAGEFVESALDGQLVGVTIAARCVFIAVVPGDELHHCQVIANQLRDDVEREISRARSEFGEARRVDDRGASSGSAPLAVVEWGLTIPTGRSRPN